MLSWLFFSTIPPTTGPNGAHQKSENESGEDKQDSRALTIQMMSVQISSSCELKVFVFLFSTNPPNLGPPELTR